MNRAPRTLPPFVIHLFLVIGLVSVTAFRLITIVNSLRPALVRPLWYVGVVGHICFFAYRYHISEKRKKAIIEGRLLEKLNERTPLDDNDRERITYVLASIVKSREHINYLFIFVLSLAAIAVDILLAAHSR